MTPTDKLFMMNLDQNEFAGFSFLNPEFVQHVWAEKEAETTSQHPVSFPQGKAPFYATQYHSVTIIARKACKAFSQL